MSSCFTPWVKEVVTIRRALISIEKHDRVRSMHAQVFDTPATTSDHRAILLSVKGQPRTRIMNRREQLNPSGWTLTDKPFFR